MDKDVKIPMDCVVARSRAIPYTFSGHGGRSSDDGQGEAHPCFMISKYIFKYIHTLSRNIQVALTIFAQSHPHPLEPSKLRKFILPPPVAIPNDSLPWQQHI